MTERGDYPFVPDVPMPPGETIAELLEERGITQSDFAQLLGRTEKNVSQLINGKAPLGHDLAIDLERVLGAPSSFWNNLESTYRDLLARQEARDRLAAETTWAKKFPLKAMESQGFIARESSTGECTADLLDYFGVASTDAWQGYWSSPRRLAARMTGAYTPDIPALTAWLRAGELAARTIETAPFSARGFEIVVRNAPPLTSGDIRQTFPALRVQCAQVGVALVLVPELPKIRCSGVSRWLASDKALIQLCLRHKTADQLWLSFFHEACHILRHSKKRTYVAYLNEQSHEELEANVFAADTLIQPSAWADFTSRGKPSKARVLEFATIQGIAPGVVVGRLQHEKIVPFAQMNDLKVPLVWA
jgi:HTH-type transcriptional regulator/antitoxin HigA